MIAVSFFKDGQSVIQTHQAREVPILQEAIKKSIHNSCVAAQKSLVRQKKKKGWP